MKAAPVIEALNKFSDNVVIHTGQHTDANMSDAVMSQLGLKADVTLSHGNVQQMKKNILQQLDLHEVHGVFVYGDVHSTLAGALAAHCSGHKLYHVESGLRSGDNSMPEEINRIVVDELSDVLFVTEPAAMANLEKEGLITPGTVTHFVGNTMIDSLKKIVEALPARNAQQNEGDYILMTLHRPSNVDDHESLKRILDAVESIGTKVIFPVHPRTRALLPKTGYRQINFIEPLLYSAFVSYMHHAKAVITDSGGVQEETTWLNVPCFTLRKNTERPCTIEVGTNMLITNLDLLGQSVKKVIAEGVRKSARIPEKCDGRAAERIAEIVKSEYIPIALAQASH
jgi:UDP-N-acetylglucosamine 2-epimerase (non-hydrolysing)